MYFLGIETSCDETAAAVVQCADAHALLNQGEQARILAEEVSSQVRIHEAYGGVVPELASRAHLTNLPWVVEQVLRSSGVRFSDLTAIGVTQGPGLKGCLMMGSSFAKALCLAQGLALIGVNHIEAHIHAAMMDNQGLRYPFLALVVSGGHTEIVEVRGLGRYHIWARSIDDAAGEAFDKSANLLGFDYPGGAALAALADTCSGSPFYLPRVMREAEGFSFSGLKTAISVLIKEQESALSYGEGQTKAFIAHAVQEAIVEALCHKLVLALRQTKARSVSVTGGVSANRRLRQRIKEIAGNNAFFPAASHCMDNAAMVAYTAALRYGFGQRDGLDMAVMARWPVEDLIAPPQWALEETRREA